MEKCEDEKCKDDIKYGGSNEEIRNKTDIHNQNFVYDYLKGLTKCSIV